MAANVVIAFMKKLPIENDVVLKVMDLGCGSSPFSRILYERSPIPVGVVGLDYAESAVASAKKKFRENGITIPGTTNSSLSFTTADARSMPFRDASFDIIVDKGTMDSALKHQKLGNALAQEMALELVRVLKINRHILQFTDEDPELRLSLWDNFVSEMKLSDIELNRTFQVLETGAESEQREMFMYVIEKMQLPKLPSTLK
ncbi:citrate synthase-lysine N-methyltransferase CSKMT, mitochondrial-like [Lineus longissimus]|uniref:citrate synthase-lysine N-methyltransferase CSKMT, mitochondrial-like n=1 Tax=Lineus longissimus TaxID=88925 RepID=UPI00315D2912